MKDAAFSAAVKATMKPGIPFDSIGREIEPCRWVTIQNGKLNLLIIVMLRNSATITQGCSG
jgi:hypothetical protein